MSTKRAFFQSQLCQLECPSEARRGDNCCHWLYKMTSGQQPKPQLMRTFQQEAAGGPAGATSSEEAPSASHERRKKRQECQRFKPANPFATGVPFGLLILAGGLLALASPPSEGHLERGGSEESKPGEVSVGVGASKESLAGELPPGGQIEWSLGGPAQAPALSAVGLANRQLIKKSTMEEVSSADLPAEFRDAGPEPELEQPEATGQSRLAKLCQQTSSVLASVLPAPFGGHKRSVLCQFFGHVPFSLSGAKKQRPALHQQQPEQDQRSFAILHQQEQKPVAFLTSGLHPLEIVLRHQQQQQQQMVQRPEQDLKAAASLVDFAYQQRLEPPAGMSQLKAAPVKPKDSPRARDIKFSAPITATSFKPLGSAKVAPQVASSNQNPNPASAGKDAAAWRIFGQLPPEAAGPESGGAQAKLVRPSENSTTTSTTSTTTPQPEVRPPSALVLGKPPGANKSPNGTEEPAPKTSIAKRTEALKSTTPKMGAEHSQAANASQTPTTGAQKEPANVRTIEVLAQQLSNETSSNVIAAASTTAKPPADPRQVQKREELVIASINNLTRIAFGNHLRDTVKVINKLIDQQASLFSHPKTANGEEPLAGAETSGKPTTIKMPPAGKSGTTGKAAGGSQLTTKSARQKQLSSLATLATAKPTKKPASVGKKSVANKTSSPASRPKPEAAKKITQATPFSARDAKSTAKPQADNAKWTVPARAESRRLSSLNSPANLNNKPASRSLSFSNSPSTSPFAFAWEQTQSTRPLADLDPMKVASTMVDLQRDSNRFSGQQLNSIGPQRHKPDTSRAAPFSPMLGSPGTRLSRPTMAPVAATKPAKVLEQTTSNNKYPWLVPDKSIVSELLGGSVVSSARGASWAPELDRKLQFGGLKASSGFTKWSIASGGSTKKFSTVSIPATERASEAPDRKPTTKLDSLTTLKMSLSSTTSTTTTQAPSTSQSRWIPTITRALPVTLTSSTTTSTTTARPSSTTALPDLTEMASRPETQSTQANTQTLSDLIEARASDTVSKYTTHLNQEANELLATTRRLYPGNQPQIAHTGEFFSAETIATWPERYQTMLDSLQSTPSLQVDRDQKSSTQAQFETTRRNGETYDESQALATTAARHRFSGQPEPTGQRTAQTTTPEVAGLTVLPSNHKLVLQEELLTTGEFSTRQQQQGSSSTQALASSSTTPAMQPETSKAANANQAYTLVGPYSGPETILPLEELAGTTIKAQFPMNLRNSNNNETGQHNSMRPPYITPEAGQPSNIQPGRFEPENQKPYVSRKLYELLVPPTRSFVGPSQNSPLNAQKFNLSALKFLAQSLLSSQAGNETSSPDSLAHFSSAKGEQFPEAPAYNSSHQQQLRLLELLNISLPSSYYDFLDSNESTQFRNATGHDKSTIFNKASNLLTDLRRLEQKKAAAILAAIRYQVPGPLVRPWDLASDLYGPGGFISDRFDRQDQDDDDDEQNAFRENFLSAYLSSALRSPLMMNKQRVVPRAELEARLRSRSSGNGNHQTLEEEQGERRADVNNYEREFSLVDNSQRQQPETTRRNLTRALLDKLLNFSDRKASGQEEFSGNNRTNDFDLINLSVNNSNSNERASIGDVEFVDTDNSNRFRYSGDTKQAKQHTSDLNPKHKSNSSELLHNATGSKEEPFDCSHRQAGFYPDADSACQTFYHCSNTGHLLTFNCPQQTRFDEKSLKCGPWFEISCVIKSSSRHHHH